jgi:hypothetical protein
MPAMRRTVRSLPRLLALAAMLAAGIPLAWTATASARGVLLAHGQAGPYPWTLRTSATTIGSGKTPALCSDFEWAWGVGQPIGNGFPSCTAAARGVYVGSKLHWVFDLRAGAHGVAPEVSGGGASPGILGVVVLVVPSTRRVEVTLADGRVLKLRTVPVPARLNRPARIAWWIRSGNYDAAALKIRRVFAYNSDGRVVGHFHS